MRRFYFSMIAFFFLFGSSNVFAQWSTGSGGKIYYNGGAVGIGVSNPARILHLTDGAEKLLRFSRSGVGTWDLGINSNDAFAIFENGVTDARLIIANDGNIGIRTSSPARALHITDDAEQMLRMSHTGVGTWDIGVKNDDSFAIYEDGVSGAQMSIASGGDMSVNGTINAEEIQVTTNVVPDYVFADSYDLRPIAELKAYVTEHKHLPGIPSEKEVLEEGLLLGEMNMKLLEKIEELTLYIIQQQEQIEALEATLQTLDQH